MDLSKEKMENGYSRMFLISKNINNKKTIFELYF